jgi:glycosyltransferase involved in cell wall biosynthesis
MRIAQVVLTDAFAGTERHVATIAPELASRGHEVVVIGGHPELMSAHLGQSVRWKPGGSPAAGMRTLVRSGRFDIVHAHLTDAEAAASLTSFTHHGRLVVTRHIVADRGSSPLGRRLRPFIERHIDAEIAVSHHLVSFLDLRGALVVPGGVPNADNTFNAASRTVVIAQRLEPEKDTLTGLRAFAASQLAASGWRLAVAGDGSQRAALEREWRDGAAIDFLGHVADLSTLWPQTGIALAPTAIESQGLAVLEAMAAGIPVVAAAAGGHVETVGRLADGMLFPAGDVASAARCLTELAAGERRRAALGAAGRDLQRNEFTVTRQVDQLLAIYADVLAKAGA